MASALSTRTQLATGAALIGFAANSLLCRAALRSGAIDAAIDAWSFTAVRLGGGALTLGLLARLKSRRGTASGGSLASALALYGYAAAFSLAYLRLATGVGALILFASVQATMIGWGIVRGARPSALEWIGFAVALVGLLVLTLPGASVPDRLGLVLMVCSGVAWGVYSLRGRANLAPLAATSGNFARSVPFALVALLAARTLDPQGLHVSARGVWLALASGALASGLGYSLWYLALPGLSALHAALLQLTVPVLVGLAGILLLGESLTVPLAIAAPLVLGGVACALVPCARARRAQ